LHSTWPVNVTTAVPRRPFQGVERRFRDELMQAARQLLMTAERETDLSIRAVTRAAGAAPQSFSLQFASLDELLYAVYALEFEDLRQVMIQAANSTLQPTARRPASSGGGIVS
jgi:AcrR family transcriptional regulator